MRDRSWKPRCHRARTKCGCLQRVTDGHAFVMKTVAIENRDAGLRANVILPGTIDTPANRQSSPDADFSTWVRPTAIASLITWLAGDAGRDINGAAIPIYGSEI